MNNAASTLDLEMHPACLIMPEMDDEEFEKLKEDISGFGLRHKITLYQGKILDGRHRYRACMELGIEPEFEHWPGGSAVIEFVIGENLLRRHLTVSQKAMVAAKAIDYHRAEARERQREAHLSRGINDKDTDRVPLQRADTPDETSDNRTDLSAPGALRSEGNVLDFPKGKAAAAAAKDVGASPRTVEQAVYVKEHGTEEDVKDVEQGKVSVKAKAAEIKERKAPEPIVSEYITPVQWLSLSEEERAEALTKPTTKKLNVQSNESIDWAAFSWNPITGCDHGCEYCYARDIANRYYGDLGFAPALHPQRIHIPSNHKDSGKKNNRVFTCSMSDLFAANLPKEWIDAVLEECANNTQFDFLLLTKNPKRLRDFSFPRNCWVGTTTDTQRRMDVAESIFKDVDAKVKWVSAEPMMEPIIPKDASSFDWYVIGGASRTTQQPGFVPPYDWVFRLALAAHDAGSQSFIKTNFWDNGRPTNFPTITEAGFEDYL